MNIKRSNIRLTADPSKVILLFLDLGNPARYPHLAERFLKLSEAEREQLWQATKQDFAHRHRDYEASLLENLAQFEKHLGQKLNLSDTGKLLLGAYSTKEYSIEAAALFNPSMVRHPDQSGLASGETRFVMSLRSVGEGHISTLSLKQGIIGADNDVRFEKETQLRTTGKRVALSDSESQLLNEKERNDNYLVQFDASIPLPERVIYPFAASETLGMEDIRLVEMKESGVPRYLGTYTAYNGKDIQSKLLETEDFQTFRIRSYHKGAVQDKGMAFFPRRVNGQFVVISRQGGEDINIMFSEDLYHWKEKQLLQAPEQPWESVQMGNCGSPIETSEGWLLLTHAVGPMRRYYLSASLLDLDHPQKVIASLKHPLMAPLESEREGYVPNVLYTCGWMEHGEQLVIPYAMSDAACSFAMVEKDELLNELLKNKL